MPSTESDPELTNDAKSRILRKRPSISKKREEEKKKKIDNLHIVRKKGGMFTISQPRGEKKPRERRLGRR